MQTSYSFYLSLYYSTFSSTFVTASPPWKPARSTLNLICRMVSTYNSRSNIIFGKLIFWQNIRSLQNFEISARWSMVCESERHRPASQQLLWRQVYISQTEADANTLQRGRRSPVRSPASLQCVGVNTSSITQTQFLLRCMECTHGLAMRILSVCLSVRLSNACIVTKRKKDLSRFLYHTKDHLAQFSEKKNGLWEATSVT